MRIRTIISGALALLACALIACGGGERLTVEQYAERFCDPTGNIDTASIDTTTDSGRQWLAEMRSVRVPPSIDDYRDFSADMLEFLIDFGEGLEENEDRERTVRELVTSPRMAELGLRYLSVRADLTDADAKTLADAGCLVDLFDDLTIP